MDGNAHITQNRAQNWTSETNWYILISKNQALKILHLKHHA